jgi:hypothetical protein
MDELSVELKHRAKPGVAEACSALRNHVKHRLRFGRRATDGPQHLGGRGLLLLRLHFRGHFAHGIAEDIITMLSRSQ